MFYSKCRKCGFSRRWLTIEETKDKNIVEYNLSTPPTIEEVEAAEEEGGEDKVIIGYCAACEPKKTKKKSKKAEAVEA